MPRAKLLIEIDGSQRTFITGKTGSGKTHLAKRILRSFPRLVVLDSKGTLKPWGLEEYDRESRRRLAKGEDVRMRVPLEPGVDPEKFWDGVLAEAYEAGNVMIYLDEAGQVAGGSKPSPWVATVWQRGREYGVGAIAVTQRPVWVPRLFISEADHVFQFRLQLEDDRVYMSKMLGPQVADPIPTGDKYGFWYWDSERADPIYIDRLPASVEGDDQTILTATAEPEPERG